MSDLIFNISQLNNSLLDKNGSNLSNSTDENSIIAPIVQFLNSYYTIFIIVVGLIGNTITIIIFWRTKLTHTKKTSFYLISLALSDIGFLLVLLFKYCDDHGVFAFSKQSIACKLSVYLGYIFNFLSCSLIFTFTLQRLLVICFPLRVNFLNLERGSKLLVILLLGFACLFYSVTLFLYDIELNKEQKKICTTKNGFDQRGEQFNFLDSLFTLIIPFFGLLIMNAIIIRTLKQSSYNFIIRTSNNHLTYEPRNSLIANNKNSENFYKIQEGVLAGTGPVTDDVNSRKKSISKNGSYFKKTFKKAKEFDYFESDSKIVNESMNGSAILSSYKTKKSKTNCLFCKAFKTKFKSNDAIFSTNLLTNSNTSPPYMSTRQSILMSSIKTSRKQSNVRIDESNMPELKKHTDSKKNSVELSSLLNKKTDFKARTSFRIGGTKTNSVSRKVTKMLIVVSSTFLVLNLPVHSNNVYLTLRIFLHGEKSIHPIEWDLREICHFLFYTSFSCNFLLYSISGATFRTEFKRLVLSLFRINKQK